MGVRRYQDLFTWQLANAFNEAVRQCVARSREAQTNFRFRDQLLEASRVIAPDVAEGFARYSRAQFRQFLDYALGSLAEAETRFREGVASGYFSQDELLEVTRHAKRCGKAIVRLKQSQEETPDDHRKPRRKER